MLTLLNIEHKLHTNDQVSDAGSDEPLVLTCLVFLKHLIQPVSNKTFI